MKPIDIQSSRLNNALYKDSFAVIPAQHTKKDVGASKPIVNIQYINADELEGNFIAKPKQSVLTQKPKEDMNRRTKKRKPALFSLSHIGIGLMTIGALDFTVKHYLSGSVLCGMGLLSYGIGQSLKDRH